MRPILIAFLAGLASATAFAPLSLWPLMPLAFAIVLHLLGRAAGTRQALAVGWAFGFGQFVLGLNWIATAFTYQAAMPAWLGWIAIALLSLYLAVYPMLACGLAFRFGRHADGRAMVLAAAWIVTEWLRAGMFTGFAWNPVGVIWVGTPVAGAATLVGTYGLGGITVLAGGAALALAGRHWRGAAALALLPVLAMVPAAMAQDRPDTGRAIRVVQPNIDQDLRNSPDFAYEGLVRVADLSRQNAADGPPRLLMWPEAAVEYYLEDDPAARRAVAGLLRPGDILLTGGTALERDAAGELIGARNSLFAMDATGRILARYDKAHLVPYGEYLPARPILSVIGLSRLVPGDLDFWSGPGPSSYTLPGFGSMGVQICYEIIFSGEVVDPAHRPDFLFNPSNDAWFGAWGPPQHLAQARLRAIEEGLPVVRSTPNGISAVIDARGTLLSQIPRHTAGVIDARLPAPHAPTPFARLGNALPLAFALLLAAAAIAMQRRRRYGT